MAADPVAPFALAFNIAMPAAMPVTMPAGETVATAVLSLDHVTIGVLTFPDPSLTTADRGTLPPIATVAGATVIVYVTVGVAGGGAVGALSPPHPPTSRAHAAARAATRTTSVLSTWCFIRRTLREWFQSPVLPGFRVQVFIFVQGYPTVSAELSGL